MRIDRDATGAGPIVTGFGPSGYRVGPGTEGERFQAILLTVATASAWSPPSLDALAIGDIQPLVDAGPEFILLGTGPTLRRPSPALVAALATRDIGLEPMDSRAAARAWGVLRSEGRRIAAALYPLD